MGLPKNNIKPPEQVTKSEFDEWNQITFKAFYKIWILVLAVELLLFVFYKPNSECGRIRYFWLFIVKPSGMQGIAMLIVIGLSKIKRKIYYKQTMFLSTIILISIFAASAIWIHTSVELMSMLLMLPLIITTLYKDKFLTWVQLLICVSVYALKELYFYPHTPYFPPLNNFINISIFCGSILVELFLIQHVQDYVKIMEKRADVDSMTGLYNHKMFYKQLYQEYMTYQKNGTPFSLIVIDIDHFKNINDTYGHAFGDEVICRIAKLIKSLTVPCHCSRYGGEEFSIIIPDTRLDSAVEIAEYIRTQFANESFDTNDGIKRFSISVGVSETNEDCNDSKDIFLKADEQLYKAKQNGRNKVCS